MIVFSLCRRSRVVHLPKLSSFVPVASSCKKSIDLRGPAVNAQHVRRVRLPPDGGLTEVISGAGGPISSSSVLTAAAWEGRHRPDIRASHGLYVRSGYVNGLTTHCSIFLTGRKLEFNETALSARSCLAGCWVPYLFVLSESTDNHRYKTNTRSPSMRQVWAPSRRPRHAPAARMATSVMSSA